MRWAAVAWLAGLASCQQAAVFGCDDSEQCRQDSALGSCEVNGFCSFSDETCPSGRRYSELAGDGLGGLCVLDDEAPSTDGTSTTGTASTTSPATTTDAMPATLSRGSSESSSGTETTNASSSSTTGSTSPVPEDGLVVWMSFENPSADEGTSLDLSGNDFHGTCEVGRCPDPVPGPVGMAARFDGLNDRIDIADRPELRFETGMSVSLWATYEGEVQTSIVFGKPFEDQDRNSYELFLSGDRAQRLHWSMDAAEMLEGSASVLFPFSSPDGWVHLVGTWDGDAMVLYVDGVQAEARTGVSNVYDTHPVTIGGDLIGFKDAHFWTGAVDELRIYDRSLSAIEVTLLYEQGLESD